MLQTWQIIHFCSSPYNIDFNKTVLHDFIQLSSLKRELLQSGGSKRLPKQEGNLSRYNSLSSLYHSTDEEKQI